MAVLRNTTGATPPPTPTAPSLLSPAQGATPPQPVALDSTDVTAATSYRIQIDDSSNFTNPLVVDQTVTASQFTAPTLASRQHWWRVRGINSAGVAGPFSVVRRFTPQAPPAAASLSAVSLNPTSVVGGSASQGTVTLTSPAPSGGFVVTLSSNNAAATVPASVTVRAGATSTTFTATTSAVSTSTPLAVTAIAAGVTRTCTFTLNGAASVTGNVQ